MVYFGIYLVNLNYQLYYANIRKSFSNWRKHWAEFLFFVIIQKREIT